MYPKKLDLRYIDFSLVPLGAWAHLIPLFLLLEPKIQIYNPIFAQLSKLALLNDDLSITIKGRYFADSFSGLLVDFIFAKKEQRSMVEVHQERARYTMQHLDRMRGNDARMYFMG